MTPSSNQSTICKQRSQKTETLHMVHDVNKVSSNKNVRQMNGKTKKDRTELNTLVNGLGPS